MFPTVFWWSSPQPPPLGQLSATGLQKKNSVLSRRIANQYCFLLSNYTTGCGVNVTRDNYFLIAAREQRLL